MRSSKYCSSLLIFTLIFTVCVSQVNASALDKYRAIISSGHFTFKCSMLSYSTKEIRNAIGMPEDRYITPSESDRQMSEQKTRQERANQGFFTRPVDIFVMDGDNRYTEIGSKCKLIKDGEVYTFCHVHMYDSLNGIAKDEYVGGHISKRGYVHQDEIMPGKNYWPQGRYLMYERSFQSQDEVEDVGAPMLMKMLAVIYPLSRANVELPEYSFVKNGQTADGDSYEDYSGELGGRFHAVRCYFRGGELVKMAYASYVKDAERPQDEAEKYVIEIKEISSVPERRYFSLPVELKIIKE